MGVAAGKHHDPTLGRVTGAGTVTIAVTTGTVAGDVVAPAAAAMAVTVNNLATRYAAFRSVEQRLIERVKSIIKRWTVMTTVSRAWSGASLGTTPGFGRGSRGQ